MNFVRSTTDIETRCNPGTQPAEQVIEKLLALHLLEEKIWSGERERERERGPLRGIFILMYDHFS